MSEDVVNVIDGEEGDCCTSGPTTSEGADASATFWLAEEKAGIGNAHVVGDLADGIVTHASGTPGVISNASGSIGQALLKNASNLPEWTTIPSSVSLSSATPYTVGTASAGVASTASRSDHRHDLPDVVASATVAYPASLTYDAKGRITGSTAGTAGVSSSRTIATTSPLLIDGGASADLSANRTLSIPAATNSVAGHATAAQITALEAATTAIAAHAARTIVTVTDETATFANSRRLVAGTNVTFDVSVAGVLTVNASGGSGGYATIENNGTPVTQRTTLNLSPEFTATDDAGDTETDLELATNGVAYAKLAQLAGLSVLGNGTNSTADLAAITAGTTGHVLRRSGTAVAFGTLEAGAFADTIITGAKLAGFTNNTIPIGNSSTQLTNSTLTLASNLLTHTASSGSAVAQTIENTGAGSADFTMTAGTAWKWSVQNADTAPYADPLTLKRGAAQILKLTQDYAYFGGTDGSGADQSGANCVATSAHLGVGNQFYGGTTASSGEVTAAIFKSRYSASFSGSVAVEFAAAVGVGLSTPGGGYAKIVTQVLSPNHGVLWISTKRSGTYTEAARWDQWQNTLLGGATAPTTAEKTLVIGNSVTPSVAPTSSIVHYSEGGVARVVGTDGIAIVL